MSTTSIRRPRPFSTTRLRSDNVHAGTFIGPSIRIDGRIEAAQPVTVAGHVHGEISVPGHRVAVLAEGQVRTRVRAYWLLAKGKLAGEVRITAGAAFVRSRASRVG